MGTFDMPSENSGHFRPGILSEIDYIISCRVRVKGTRKDGCERWEALSSHADSKSALVSLAEYRVRCIGSSAPEQIIRAIEEIKREVISSAEVFRNSAG
jgi:hypothetical protein